MAVAAGEVEAGEFGRVAAELGLVQTVDPFAALDLLREPEKCTLHVARRDGKIVSYLHLYLNGLAIYRLAGEQEGASALLGFVGSGPAIFMCQSHLADMVRRKFSTVPYYVEYLMTVKRGESRDFATGGEIRLEPDDAQELYDLYASGEFSSRTAYNSVDAYRTQVGKEATFAIRADSKLVSAATAFGGDRSFGMVGTVFTAREHRGKGYGTAVTSAATAHVLGVSERALLYVRADNIHAIHSYEKIGYSRTEDWCFFDLGTGIVP